MFLNKAAKKMAANKKLLNSLISFVFRFVNGKKYN